MDIIKNYIIRCKNWSYRHLSSYAAYNLKKKEKKYKFKDYLSIVCIAKNEGEYIKEWVDYHILAGVDRIYLYDNESNDNMHDILEPYISTGKLIYTFFPGKGRQLDAYNDAINRFKMESKYFAFIDCDEFLLPENDFDLKKTIDNLMKLNNRAGGIAVNWRMFGSSGYESKPEGGVIKNFVYRGSTSAPGNECIKTIANPRFILKYEHVHFPTYYLGFNSVNEDGKIVISYENKINETKYIRINHYFTKSKEEWIKRRSLGKADCMYNSNRTLEEFYIHDNNDIYDDLIIKFLKEKEC